MLIERYLSRATIGFLYRNAANFIYFAYTHIPHIRILSRTSETSHLYFFVKKKKTTQPAIPPRLFPFLIKEVMKKQHTADVDLWKQLHTDAKCFSLWRFATLQCETFPQRNSYGLNIYGKL